MSPPSVTVSVLAFDSEATIERCVRSCVALEYGGTVEIIVREQAGNDAEMKLLESLVAEAAAAGRTLHLSRGANLGFSAGHNLAIRASAADLVLVLNADAALAPDFLTSAIDAFDDPAVGAVQGKVLQDGTDRIDTVGLLPLQSRSVRTRGHGADDDGRFAVAADVFGADGAAPLYRRRALDDVAIPFDRFEPTPREGAEYFDESFFAYKEDVDLAWRLQWRGWRTRYEPRARAWHTRGARTTAAAGPSQAVADRMRMSPTARALGFANQRLMQLKNEDGAEFARATARWLPREAASWTFGLVTDPRLVKAVGRLARLAPVALRKRRHVMDTRSPDADPYRWFVRSAEEDG